jgi:enoyl-CoA hydratase/carnithine racemase
VFKRAVYQSFQMPLAAHLDMVSSHMSVIIDTPEHKALVDRFLQRRKSGKPGT